MKKRKKNILNGSLITVLTLFGGIAIGLAAGDITFNLIPGSNFTDVKPSHAAFAALPALAGFLAGGAIWGILIGKNAGVNDKRALARAGMLGFGPITILLAVCLGLFEPFLVAKMGQFGIPIHRVFTFIFVLSAFLIAGISAWAIGGCLQNPGKRKSLFWKVGLTAAAAFLIVNLVMETAGWVVGAPGAAEKATMLTILAIGNLAAAISGGAVIGWTTGS